MSCEAGGLNSTTPFIVAAELGIPLVDADMMGRAFPELQMCTPTLYGVTATPMAIADEKGNSAILNTIGNKWTETFARTLTIDMGCSAMIALYPMTGKQVKESRRPPHDLPDRADRPRDPRRPRAARRPDRGGARDHRWVTSIWRGKVGRHRRGAPKPASPAARPRSPASASTRARRSGSPSRTSS